MAHHETKLMSDKRAGARLVEPEVDPQGADQGWSGTKTAAGQFVQWTRVALKRPRCAHHERVRIAEGRADALILASNSESQEMRLNTGAISNLGLRGVLTRQDRTAGTAYDSGTGSWAIGIDV